MEEKKVDSEVVFSGKILTVKLDKVLLPGGSFANRELIEHPGAVAVVPILNDGRIIFVRQYRYPIKDSLLEIPAGKLDPGEDPDKCVLRELEEETGYVAGRIHKLGAVYTTPGFTNEIIHLYVAEDLSESQQNLDEDEILTVECYTPAQVQQMIESGVLKDSKTLLALLLADRQRNGGKS